MADFDRLRAWGRAAAVVAVIALGGIFGFSAMGQTPVSTPGKEEIHRQIESLIREAQGEATPLPAADRPVETQAPPSLDEQLDGLAKERNTSASGQPGALTSRLSGEITGTSLVGVVNDRVLTRAELEKRVSQLMVFEKIDPKAEDYEELKLKREGVMLSEWADRAMLAEEAERREIVLSEGEFEAAFQKVIEQRTDKSELDVMLDIFELTNDELRRELRDSLLGRKLVDMEVEKYNTEEYLKPRYEQAPHLFFRPPQIHVLHYSMVLGGYENKRELNDARTRMETARKRLDKGEDPRTVAKDQGGLKAGVVGTDLGWLTPELLNFKGQVTLKSNKVQAQGANSFSDQSGLMPAPEVAAVLIKMESGQTSRVIESKDSSGLVTGLHLVRVVEKRPAVGQTFESARPVMLEALKVSIRQWLLGQIRDSGNHRIVLNTRGIRPEVLERPAKAKTKAPSDNVSEVEPTMR